MSHPDKIIVQRVSEDEATFTAIVYLNWHVAWGKRLSDKQILEAVIAAVTEWVENTPEGKDAWEESEHDFNIGDLADCNLEPINSILEKNSHFSITDIEIFPPDALSDDWIYDDVLVRLKKSD